MAMPPSGKCQAKGMGRALTDKFKINQIIRPKSRHVSRNNLHEVQGRPQDKQKIRSASKLHLIEDREDGKLGIWRVGVPKAARYIPAMPSRSGEYECHVTFNHV